MTNVPFITRIEISGLHGHADVDLRLKPGLNVVFGSNGTGKTTILHIIANLLEGDVERFTYLRFGEIRVTWSSEDVVVLRRKTVEGGLLVTFSINGEFVEDVARDGRLQPKNRAILRQLSGGRPVYLPAFRSVLEAISRERPSVRYPTERSERQVQQIRESELEEYTAHAELGPPVQVPYRERTRAENVAHKTLLCREWFGQFVPVVRFPSLTEVATELSEEYQSAELQLAQRDRVAFSEVFVQVLRTVFERAEATAAADTSTVLGSIRKSLDSLQEGSNVPTAYNELASVMRDSQQVPVAQEVIASRILAVYEAALQRRLRSQGEAFRQIRTFETSVNRFLEGKTLIVGFEGRLGERRPRARVRLEDGREAHISVLSSGERHVLTLLFSATHMPATPGILLLDEPELSLHVDWQRMVLGELMSQIGDHQTITCTHAPEVAADHSDAIIKLTPRKHVGTQPELFGTSPQVD